jgi:ribose/xylose/arabinose/galactoside ABC-type transport system permease subunit
MVAVRARPDRPVSPTLRRHLLLALGAGVVLFLLSTQIGAYDDYNLTAVAIFAVAAAGLNLLTGLNGQLSLGHGALMAIGAYTASLLLKDHRQFPVVVVLLLAVLSTGVIGIVFGYAAARLRGPYLAGATLTLAIALPQVATRYKSIFGGESGLTVPQSSPPAWLGVDFPPERWLAWIALAAAVVTMVLLANLLRSSVGRAFKAVRDDEAAAALAGIDVARTQVLAFVISAACAGLAESGRRRVGFHRAGLRAAAHQRHGQQVEPAEFCRRQPAARDLRRHPCDRHARGSARHPGRASENACTRPGSLGEHPARWAEGGGGLGRSRTRYLVAGTWESA